MDLDEGDMDIVEATGNFTEELNSFYSEIGFIPGQDEPRDEGAAAAAAVGVSSSPPPGTEGGGESSPGRRPESEPEEPGSSAPGSPAPTEAKRRKKVKVTGTLSMKKKGLGDMLEKWRKIHH